MKYVLFVFAVFYCYCLLCCMGVVVISREFARQGKCGRTCFSSPQAAQACGSGSIQCWRCSPSTGAGYPGAVEDRNDFDLEPHLVVRVLL